MNENFVKKLKEIRKNKGMTQQQMADKLCMELRTYQNIEYNKNKKMDISKINDIAKALNENFDSLVDFAKMQYIETVTDKSVGIVNGNVTMPEPQTDISEVPLNKLIELESLKKENTLLKSEIDFYRSVLKDKISA
jgi:transcriptional regulator with XRE-family HTH domain